jgi:hypothetical protein
LSSVIISPQFAGRIHGVATTEQLLDDRSTLFGLCKILLMIGRFFKLGMQQPENGVTPRNELPDLDHLKTKFPFSEGHQVLYDALEAFVGCEQEHH